MPYGLHVTHLQSVLSRRDGRIIPSGSIRLHHLTKTIGMEMLLAWLVTPKARRCYTCDGDDWETYL
ncbi:hypothetical protein RhiLY_03871 [Ceratobasidium sp. AG-Ba]|nr:hypothetical protein RhiLY_03871 [Ceratobasidium sp. AG-Ba]